MRFQGNEGDLLENSSNVKELLQFAVRDLPSSSQKQTGNFVPADSGNDLGPY